MDLKKKTSFQHLMVELHTGDDVSIRASIMNKNDKKVEILRNEFSLMNLDEIRVVTNKRSRNEEGDIDENLAKRPYLELKVTENTAVILARIAKKFSANEDNKTGKIIEAMEIESTEDKCRNNITKSSNEEEIIIEDVEFSDHSSNASTESVIEVDDYEAELASILKEDDEKATTPEKSTNVFVQPKTPKKLKAKKEFIRIEKPKFELPKLEKPKNDIKEPSKLEKASKDIKSKIESTKLEKTKQDIKDKSKFIMKPIEKKIIIINNCIQS